MIFKIIAFLAAAIPIFLFIRSIFFRRTTRINEGLREFNKQANLYQNSENPTRAARAPSGQPLQKRPAVQ